MTVLPFYFLVLIDVFLAFPWSDDNSRSLARLWTRETFLCDSTPPGRQARFPATGPPAPCKIGMYFQNPTKSKSVYQLTLSVYPFAIWLYPFIHLSVYLFIRLSVYPFIRKHRVFIRSVYPAVYPDIDCLSDMSLSGRPIQMADSV